MNDIRTIALRGNGQQLAFAQVQLLLWLPSHLDLDMWASVSTLIFLYSFMIRTAILISICCPIWIHGRDRVQLRYAIEILL